MKMWKRLVPNSRYIEWRDISVVRDPRLTPDHPAQGSKARKLSPHKLWL